ncbi:MAG TPA: TonB family protein [Bacteroidia bacterium]|nr:TonB family protein [Bacteroidia bacterium]
MKQLILFFLCVLHLSVFAQDTTDITPAPIHLEELSGDTQIFLFCETMPMLPGGEGAFQTYLRTSIIYPETELLLQQQGTVYVYFVVNASGTIANVQVAKGVPGSPGFDREAMRVIAAMPNWIPATMNGRKVRCAMTVPVKFVVPPETVKDTVNSTPASFPGGENPLQEYLKNNLVYPDSAYNAGDSGTVLIRFIVESDGSISRPTLAEPYRTPRTLRKESLRLIAAMPRWTPAIKDGQAKRSGVAVAVKFTLPTKKEMKNIRKKNKK